MIRKGLLFALVIILPLLPTVGYAQTSDRDGDGIPDTSDKCPDQAGPRENNGCPLPPADGDGDGVPDSADACPAESGPNANAGCPVRPPAPAENPPAEPPPTEESAPEFVLPTLPTDGPCVIATRSGERVNVRNVPSLEGEIITQLKPADRGKEAYLVVKFQDILISSYQTGGSDQDQAHGGGEIEIESWSFGESQSGEETWFMTPEGWVFGEVIRQGGDCTELPSVEMSNNLKQIGLALHNYSYSFEVVDGLLPGFEFDENGLPAVQCDASLQEIFDCDGSVHPFDGFSNVFFIGDLFDLALGGDADGDGDVDGRDFLIWQRGGSPSTVPQDSIDSSDLADWQANYGAGSFIVPLLEDEVLVAFASGDPDQPYIIGSLPNAEDRPTEEVAFYYNKIAFNYALPGSQSDVVPTDQFSLNFGTIDFEGQEGGINDITHQIPGVYAAVAIPAFMKNARKAKTAEVPLVIVLTDSLQDRNPGPPDLQSILVIAGPHDDQSQTFFILPYSVGSETPSIVVKLQIAW